MSQAPVFTENNMTRQRVHVSRVALIVYGLVLIYASLNPFVGWQTPQTITLFLWPKYLTVFDVAINTIAYIPLGALLVGPIRRRFQHLRSGLVHSLALCCAIAAGFGLSAALELMQAFLPGRVSSPVDLLTNTLGGALGAVFVSLSTGRRLIAQLGQWRTHIFAYGSTIDWGLLLLAVWFVAQLNPAIPFFEAGLIAGNSANGARGMPDQPTYDLLILLPQTVGVALNVMAFSLFVSLLLRSEKRLMSKVGVILAGGLLVKLAMAALLLKAPLIAASLSPATVFGVGAGIILFIPLCRIRYRWRAFWATILVFAGGVMAKISSVYSALEETLRIFNWPYGQLTNFTSLTRWLNEIWPLAAFVFLTIVFMRNRFHVVDEATTSDLIADPEGKK